MEWDEKPLPERDWGIVAPRSHQYADMVELLDTIDLGSIAERHLGWSPSIRTNILRTPIWYRQSTYNRQTGMFESSPQDQI